MALQLTLFFKNIFIHLEVDARDLHIIGTLHSAHVLERIPQIVGSPKNLKIVVFASTWVFVLD